MKLEFSPIYRVGPLESPPLRWCLFRIHGRSGINPPTLLVNSSEVCKAEDVSATRKQVSIVVHFYYHDEMSIRTVA